MTVDTSGAWLDRGAGSGSLTWEEAKTEEASREGPNDGRGETRTTFYDEGDPDPTENSTWTELAAFNDDMYHPDRGKQNHESDRQRIVEILSDECGCTSYQQERVQWVLDDIGSIREFYPTTSIESVVLSVVSLVVDHETTNFDNWIVRTDGFQELMDDVGMDMDKLWTIREKVRQETSVF